MARPLRIEFEGALYHVTSRGNARQPIFLNDKDRNDFLATLADVVEKFHWLCHAYCLMDNHYHLIIETPRSKPIQGHASTERPIHPGLQPGARTCGASLPRKIQGGPGGEEGLSSGSRQICGAGPGKGRACLSSWGLEVEQLWGHSW